MGLKMAVFGPLGQLVENQVWSAVLIYVLAMFAANTAHDELPGLQAATTA